MAVMAYSLVYPLLATIVGSFPCVITTVRFLLLTEGINDNLVAMNETSLESHPFTSAHVAASVSLQNRKSVKGINSSSTALNGGTCIRNGADKLRQYNAPVSIVFLEAIRIESGDTVAKKPALYTILAAERIAMFASSFK